MTIQNKDKIIKDFAKSSNDTGSVEVQCALLTERIKSLTEHLKDHKKDFSSRNGLTVLVARRKRLLKYLEKKDKSSYEKLIKELGLKALNNDN